MIGTTNIISSDFSYQDENHLSEKLLNNGVIKHSINNEIRWTNRLITMTSGSLPTGEVSGYHDLIFPADGTTINLQAGGTRTVVAGTNNVATGGIFLNAWEALWYEIPKGTTNTSIAANYLIANYTANNTQILTDDWVLICSRDDNNKIHWFNGIGTTMAGDQIGGSSTTTQKTWERKLILGQGDGYFFSPAGNTTVPRVFGFTGSIRLIGAGSIGFGDSQGYTDITQGSKAVGTVAIGLGGVANATWRLMTPAEHPEWFAGALQGTNAISTATTTVIDLPSDNSTLYYCQSIDNTANANGTWVVAGYTVQNIPSHWIPVIRRQSSFNSDTLGILIGGASKNTLRAGDAIYMGGGHEAVTDRLHRRLGVTYSDDDRFTRFLPNNYFAGTGVNALRATTNGVAVSWLDNKMMYGISDGYASWGNQYSWINVPTVGTQIPVVENIGAGNLGTRTVFGLTGTANRYVPLGAWESLWFVPPAYRGGSTSTNGEFLITSYIANSYVPTGAVRIAHTPNAITTSGNTISRVYWADGAVTRCGTQTPTLATQAFNDGAEGGTHWRNPIIAGTGLTVAQRTPAGASAQLPPVTGILSNYGSPYNMQYRIADVNPNYARGRLELKGLIQMNANVTVAQSNIAFLPSVNVIGQPILQCSLQTTQFGDAKLIPVQVRFVNGTVGGVNGCFITAWGDSFNPANNPYFTLNINGNGGAAGISQWVSFDNITLPLN